MGTTKLSGLKKHKTQLYKIIFYMRIKNTPREGSCSEYKPLQSSLRRFEALIKTLQRKLYFR